MEWRMAGGREGAAIDTLLIMKNYFYAVVAILCWVSLPDYIFQVYFGVNIEVKQSSMQASSRPQIDYI